MSEQKKPWDDLWCDEMKLHQIHDLSQWKYPQASGQRWYWRTRGWQQEKFVEVPVSDSTLLYRWSKEDAVTLRKASRTVSAEEKTSLCSHLKAGLCLPIYKQQRIRIIPLTGTENKCILHQKKNLDTQNLLRRLIQLIRSTGKYNQTEQQQKHNEY